MNTLLAMLIPIILSSNLEQSEDHILQAVLDSGKVEYFVDTLAGGELNSIVFITNELMPEQKPVKYKGTSIIISAIRDVSISGYTVIEVVKYRSKNNKVDISMGCKNKTIRMKFRWQNAEWQMTSFKMKGKGHLTIDKEF